jgi:hypothetical protein
MYRTIICAAAALFITSQAGAQTPALISLASTIAVHVIAQPRAAPPTKSLGREDGPEGRLEKK